MILYVLLYSLTVSHVLTIEVALLLLFVLTQVEYMAISISESNLWMYLKRYTGFYLRYFRKKAHDLFFYTDEEVAKRERLKQRRARQKVLEKQMLRILLAEEEAMAAFPYFGPMPDEVYAHAVQHLEVEYASVMVELSET